MIRVAIIGAGIGAEHLAGYRALPNLFHVKTLCDLDQEKATKVIGTNDIQIADTFETILQDPDIDLIDICLPPHLHYDYCAKSLNAGKHVICEKPLVGSLAQADDLHRIATENNRILTPVFQYRYGPSTAKLHALIAAGLTGRPLVANLQTHWSRGPEYYDTPWRGTWTGESGGAVLIHAIHSHDLLCAFFGPVAKLSAFTTTRVNPIETEDCAAISFQMQNGALATSSITLGANTDTTHLQFCFKNLTVESGRTPYAPATDPWTFTARNPERQPAIDACIAETTTTHAGFAGFFHALAQALNGDPGNEITLADGRASLELVSAIYQSSAESIQVSLPIAKGHPYYSGWVK